MGLIQDTFNEDRASCACRLPLHLTAKVPVDPAQAIMARFGALGK